MRYYIANNDVAPVAFFVGGRKWSLEWPDAMLFDTLKEARKALAKCKLATPDAQIRDSYATE